MKKTIGSLLILCTSCMMTCVYATKDTVSKPIGHIINNRIEATSALSTSEYDRTNRNEKSDSGEKVPGIGSDSIVYLLLEIGIIVAAGASYFVGIHFLGAQHQLILLLTRPVAEELVFRFGIHKYLKSLIGEHAAAGVSSVLFSLYNFDFSLYGIGYTLLSGIGAVGIYELTGTIFATIGLRLFNDFILSEAHGFKTLVATYCPFFAGTVLGLAVYHLFINPFVAKTPKFTIESEVDNKI